MDNRKIPGTVFCEDREYRYVSDGGEKKFSNLFKKLTLHNDQPLAKRGGALIEYCKIILPNGYVFYGLSYRGDIDGWRQDIATQATKLNLLIAKINDGKIEVSDGNTFALTDCAIEVLLTHLTRAGVGKGDWFLAKEPVTMFSRLRR